MGDGEHLNNSTLTSWNQMGWMGLYIYIYGEVMCEFHNQMGGMWIWDI